MNASPTERGSRSSPTERGSRSSLAPFLLAGAVVLAGCSKDSDAWANQRYGEAAARSFVASAEGLLASADGVAVQTPPGGADELARVPRPFVVLQRIPDQNRLAFHPLNAQLPATMIASSLDLARGIVVVEKMRSAEANGTMVIRRRTVTRFKYSLYYAIELYDRDLKTLTVSASETHDQDKLKAHLLTLPQ